jgi:hypothetical protein
LDWECWAHLHANVSTRQLMFVVWACASTWTWILLFLRVLSYITALYTLGIAPEQGKTNTRLATINLKTCYIIHQNVISFDYIISTGIWCSFGFKKMLWEKFWWTHQSTDRFLKLTSMSIKSQDHGIHSQVKVFEKNKKYRCIIHNVKRYAFLSSIKSMGIQLLLACCTGSIVTQKDDTLKYRKKKTKKEVKFRS